MPPSRRAGSPRRGLSGESFWCRATLQEETLMAFGRGLADVIGE
jgi:hypothetical protein